MRISGRALIAVAMSVAWTGMVSAQNLQGFGDELQEKMSRPVPPKSKAPEKASTPRAGGAKPSVSADKAQPAKSEIPFELGVEMAFLHVRSNEQGCEPNCREWIAAEGLISRSSSAKLKSLLDQLDGRALPVVIQSPGGIADGGIALGKLVRERGLDVYVGSTTLTATCMPGKPGCAPTLNAAIYYGAPIDKANCASACVFALAGGINRHVPVGSKVGVHRVIKYRPAGLKQTFRVTRRLQGGIPVEVDRSLVSVEVVPSSRTEIKAGDSVYSRIRKYFAEMGIGPEMMTLLMSTSGDSLRLLSFAEMRSTNLITSSTGPRAAVGGIIDVRGAIGTAPRPALTSTRAEIPDALVITRDVWVSELATFPAAPESWRFGVVVASTGDQYSIGVRGDGATKLIVKVDAAAAKVALEPMDKFRKSDGTPDLIGRIVLVRPKAGSGPEGLWDARKP